MNRYTPQPVNEQPTGMKRLIKLFMMCKLAYHIRDSIVNSRSLFMNASHVSSTQVSIILRHYNIISIILQNSLAIRNLVGDYLMTRNCLLCFLV